MVYELHQGAEAGLIALPRAPLGPIMVSVDAEGKVTRTHQPLPEAEALKYLDPLTTLMLDGCLLVGPKGPLPYPDEVCSTIDLVGSGLQDVWTYRVVRPQAHRLDPERAILFGARNRITLTPESAATAAAAQDAANSDADDVAGSDVEAAPRERMRS